MNDTHRDSESLVGASHFSAIINGLTPHPLYLLIFGFMLAALVLCIYAFTVEDATLRLLTVVGFIVLGLAGFFVARSAELDKNTQEINELKSKLAEAEAQIENLRTELSEDDEGTIQLSHDAMRKHFVSAIKNTREALAYKNETFLEEVNNSIGAFETVTADWSKGCLVTDAASYERILCEFYSKAARKVFATSNENYMKFWNDKDKEEKIIDAHKIAYGVSGAIVTRLFMFGSVTNIEPLHIAIMERQDSLSFIRVRVLITGEDRRMGLPPEIVRDFAIIDAGEPTQTIGIESSGSVSAVSKWIFRSDPQLETSARNMEFASISLEKLKSRLPGG